MSFRALNVMRSSSQSFLKTNIPETKTIITCYFYVTGLLFKPFENCISALEWKASSTLYLHEHAKTVYRLNIFALNEEM